VSGKFLCKAFEFRRVEAVALLALALRFSAFGQGVTGSITGVVTDPASAVVPSAQVTARETRTGLVTRTETNNSGVYNFASLPIGIYEINVEAPGFKSRVQSNIQVEASRVVRLDLELQVGDVGEKVTVQAEAPLLEAENSDIGTQVNKKLLNTLPFQLSGSSRDPTSFIRLTPGATGGAFGASIAGGRAFASEVLVDGIPTAYNASTNSPDQSHPTFDSVAEFRVEAVIPPAEYGRTSSGVVTMVTRSGGNEVHGDTALLIRNSYFDARRYNAPFPILLVRVSLTCQQAGRCTFRNFTTVKTGHSSSARITVSGDSTTRRDRLRR